ncbi:hypothetical protein DLM46_24205 [Paraburkholderia lacunae]|uniref:DNA-binding protein n=1 Tax=Paraburkholderia lacunae TaxID=2211104 RepID=A0A370N3C3_9BURK|nr:hypothetical protein DLM46_24205 [Paraburkholderia lacunae]
MRYGVLARLPDGVIACIEQIVRDTCREAGEDDESGSMRERIRQQADEGRRSMAASGPLISPDVFRARLGLTEGCIKSLLSNGSVFAMEVDGMLYYPSMLADTTPDLKHLQSICRMLVPVPPSARFAFLS